MRLSTAPSCTTSPVLPLTRPLTVPPMLNGPVTEPEPGPEPEPKPEPEPEPEPGPDAEPEPEREEGPKHGQSAYLELLVLPAQPTRRAEPNMIATQRGFIIGFISICLL